MMKRIIQLFSLVLITALLNGCFLKSVHPLVKKENAIEVPGLEGTWEGEDQRWTFASTDRKFPAAIQEFRLDISFNPTGEDTSESSEEYYEYFVVYEELENGRADSSYFNAYFVELNGNLYMDLYPVDLEQFNLTLYSLHFVPVHTFARVNISGDSLNFTLFIDEWIQELIQDNRVRIKHEKLETEGGILVTASTEELQKFITKYGKMDEAYEDPMALKRKF